MVPQTREALAALSEAGFIAAEWAIGLVVLVVPVMLLMAVIPTWAARHEAAAAAGVAGGGVAVDQLLGLVVWLRG